MPLGVGMAPRGMAGVGTAQDRVASSPADPDPQRLQKSLPQDSSPGLLPTPHLSREMDPVCPEEQWGPQLTWFSGKKDTI